MTRLLTVIFSMIIFAGLHSAQASSLTVRGMNLSETDVHLYDANVSGEKSQAQVAVDQIKSLGANHIVLNPRAVMFDPRGSEVFPRTPVNQRAAERARYKRLIDYIHSQGMTVGIRPIFFVVNKDGTTPYIEKLPNGDTKIWWHGNIEPADPNAWFQSFKAYLDLYLLIAKQTGAEEFTVGAELYSMTVGIEDQWEAYPHGFPGRWNQLLKYVRAKLGESVRLMYDVNFTDDRVDSGGIGATGGELERWRYRLVDLGPPKDPVKRKKWEEDPNQGPIWRDLVEFWTGLDALGIDMYRSLAKKSDRVPEKYDDLVELLQVKADEYATQLDTVMSEIDSSLAENHSFAPASFAPQSGKPVMFKELGYRSAERGFIDPFSYDNTTDKVNIDHQAAAYEAFFRSFVGPGFAWMTGTSFWDVAIDPHRQGPKDAGFSPIGKKKTEEVIRRYFK